VSSQTLSCGQRAANRRWLVSRRALHTKRCEMKIEQLRNTSHRDVITELFTSFQQGAVPLLDWCRTVHSVYCDDLPAIRIVAAVSRT
jgi:hypothetical protein